MNCYLQAAAIAFTVWQLTEELKEFFNSRKHHQKWKDWREQEINRDIDHAHPRWPEEEVYMQQELDTLDDMQPQYFNDIWYVAIIEDPG